MLKDSSVIFREDRKINPQARSSEWITTNRYYLLKIDSARYASIYAKLNLRWADHILMNQHGGVIFRLKDNTRINDSRDNETFSHELVSANCQCPVTGVYNKVDSVFIDSAINKDWKYVFYKVLTGW